MVLSVSTIARRRLNRKAAADWRWDAIVIGERDITRTRIRVRTAMAAQTR
jgi:hypothetical protein